LQTIYGESRYTKKASDWVLVFAEDFHILSDAMALERKIKRAKSRKSILRYIADKRNRISQATPLADIVNGA
jgi:predicted GIY-YIG superfamily endonuclease